MGCTLIGLTPKGFQNRGGTRVTVDPEHSRQDALDVAVEYRMPLPVRQRQNRPRGRASDAGQRRENIDIVREFAAVLSGEIFGARVQISRTRVIAKAGPQMQHFIERRFGQ